MIFLKKRELYKRGLYITSKKLERKPESNLGQSSFPQPQPFSQSQQPKEEHKQVQKTAHATTSTSQEKQIREHKNDTMLIEEEIIRKAQRKQQQIKIRKNVFVAEAYYIYIGNVRNSSRKNLTIGSKKREESIKKKQDQTNVLQSKWRNLKIKKDAIRQEQEGEEGKLGKNRVPNLSKIVGSKHFYLIAGIMICCFSNGVEILQNGKFYFIYIYDAINVFYQQHQQQKNIYLIKQKEGQNILFK